MAQIVVRGIDDEVMRRFRERAKTAGKSAEQAVRELIERAAAEGQREEDWLERVDRLREQLRGKYGEFPSAVDAIREDRGTR